MWIAGVMIGNANKYCIECRTIGHFYHGGHTEYGGSILYSVLSSGVFSDSGRSCDGFSGFSFLCVPFLVKCDKILYFLRTGVLSVFPDRSDAVVPRFL